MSLLPAVVMGLLAAGRRGSPDVELTPLGALMGAAASTAPLIVGSVLLCLLLAWRDASGERRLDARLSAAAGGLLFALSVSPTTSPMKALPALCVGWLFGRMVVGRSGSGLVHPAVLGFALFALTWPDAVGAANAWRPWAPDDTPVEWWALLLATDNPGALGAAAPLAVALGGLVAIALGAIRWRPLLGAPLGAAVAFALLWRPGVDGGISIPLAGHLLLGTFPLGAFFFVTLPTTWATRKLSQWLYGGLFGFTVIFLRLSLPSHPDSTMSALLLMSIFAPLIDHAVAAARSSRSGHD